MNIERLSDNQIRCTLNKKDLQERNIQLSELLYGSDKAKELFREMMQKAAAECGFETEDLPLMIEAIPVDSDCLVLVVTKVEDSDELDSRFSNFTPFEEKPSAKEAPSVPALADEILNYFTQLKDFLKKGDKPSNASEGPSAAAASAAPLVKIYRFPSLAKLCEFAKVLSSVYSEEPILFKDNVSGDYYLILSMNKMSAEDFNKICNIASEFSSPVSSSSALVKFYREHMQQISAKNLLASLAKLSI